MDVFVIKHFMETFKMFIFYLRIGHFYFILFFFFFLSFILLLFFN